MIFENVVDRSERIVLTSDFKPTPQLEISGLYYNCGRFKLIMGIILGSASVILGFGRCPKQRWIVRCESEAIVEFGG